VNAGFAGNPDKILRSVRFPPLPSSRVKPNTKRWRKAARRLSRNFFNPARQDILVSCITYLDPELQLWVREMEFIERRTGQPRLSISLF